MAIRLTALIKYFNQPIEHPTIPNDSDTRSYLLLSHNANHLYAQHLRAVYATQIADADCVCKLVVMGGHLHWCQSLHNRIIQQISATHIASARSLAGATGIFDQGQ